MSESFKVVLLFEIWSYRQHRGDGSHDGDWHACITSCLGRGKVLPGHYTMAGLLCRGQVVPCIPKCRCRERKALGWVGNPSDVCVMWLVMSCVHRCTNYALRPTWGPLSYDRGNMWPDLGRQLWLCWKIMVLYMWRVLLLRGPL